MLWVLAVGVSGSFKRKWQVIVLNEARATHPLAVVAEWHSKRDWVVQTDAASSLSAERRGVLGPIKFMVIVL